jgi:hypothetical protein
MVGYPSRRELALFTMTSLIAAGHSELGLFVQGPTTYRLQPFRFPDVSVTLSFYHIKTLLDARLLTQKAGIPQKSSRQSLPPT